MMKKGLLKFSPSPLPFKAQCKEAFDVSNVGRILKH